MMRSDELYQSLLNKLTISCGRGEKRSMIQWLMEDRTGLSATEIFAGKMTDRSMKDFDEDLRRLNQGEPLQYILRYAHFRGRRYEVSPDVLIPRPETELLVDHVLGFLRQKAPHVLDIGTGSGCMAISLALELQEAQVSATDVSRSALEIAQRNALQLDARVQFRLHDILREDLSFGSWDAVVSNPPYIQKQEESSLSPSVALHEPHLALFVEDHDPLQFHRAIAERSLSVLKPGGFVLMEINEKLGDITASVVAKVGYQRVTVHKDIDQKDRFVSGYAPE